MKERIMFYVETDACGVNPPDSQNFQANEPPPWDDEPTRIGAERTKAEQAADYEIARRHIELVFGREDVVLYWSGIVDDPRSILSPRTSTRFGKKPAIGTLREVWNELLNWQSQGRSAHFVPQVCAGRKETDISAVAILKGDQDRPLRVLYAVTPPFEITSSPGHSHPCWPMKPGLPVDEATAALKRLSAHYGWDKDAAKITQPARLAGLFNLKDPEKPHYVRLVDRTIKGQPREEYLVDHRVLLKGTPEGGKKAKPEGEFEGVSYATAREMLGFIPHEQWDGDTPAEFDAGVFGREFEFSAAAWASLVWLLIDSADFDLGDENWRAEELGLDWANGVLAAERTGETLPTEDLMTIEELRARCHEIAEEQSGGGDYHRRPSKTYFGTLVKLAKVFGWKGEAGTFRPKWVADLNKDWAFTIHGSKTTMARIPHGPGKITFMSKNDFFDIYAKQKRPSEDDESKVPIAKAWFSHPARREYIGDGVVFEPGAPERPGALNMWRGLPVTPKQGDWHLMQQHILDVVASGNQAHADYITNWMAHVLQNLGMPAETVLVLLGMPGCGKGILLDKAFGRIFGAKPGLHYLLMSKPDDVVGQFNSHLGYCLYGFCDEAFFAGNKETESALKALITGDRFMIEQKFLDRFMTENHISLAMASNKDWAIPVGAGDRRYAVFRMADTYCHAKGRHPEYWNPLHEEVDSGGREAMLYDLLDRDLSKFDIRDVPETEAKTAQRQHSADGAEAWLWETLKVAEIRFPHAGGGAVPSTITWGDEPLVITKGHVHDHYIAWCRTQGHKHPLSLDQFAQKLKRLLGEDHCDTTRPYQSDGLHRPRCFRFGPIDACRFAFDRSQGIKASDWDYEF